MDLSERGTPAGAGTRDDVRHPWEVARADFLLDLLERERALSASSRVLDIGAGDGFFARKLLARVPNAEVVAWDEAYTDDELADSGAHGVKRVRTRPAGPRDLVLMLDVLEHVDDERPLLEGARALLAPGGRLVVTVPAWPRLFGTHDSRLRHRRRYAPETARALLADTGYVVLAQGGLFHSLLVPRAVDVAVSARLGRGSLVAPPLELRSPARHVMEVALRADTLLSRAFMRARIDVPGLSWWALCARARP